jgi:hypothetical protein
VVVRHALAGFVLAGIPLLLFVLWTRHADGLKALNVAGAGLTSANLARWNYGAFAQKASWPVWDTLCQRTIRDIIGHPLLMGFLVAAGMMARRFRWKLAICLGLFLVVPMVFTNLHFVHDYYPYSNGIFLIAAFGWAIVALLEAGGKRQYFGMAFLLLCLAASGRQYRSYSWRFSEDVAFGPLRPELLQAIQSYTRSSDVLIAFGTDWSSELPYDSERRALIWRDLASDLNSPPCKRLSPVWPVTTLEPWLPLVTPEANPTSSWKRSTDFT